MVLENYYFLTPSVKHQIDKLINMGINLYLFII